MKIWLFIATVLIVIGILLFVGVMTANGWDFDELSINEYETVEEEITEEFSDIKITAKNENVRILPSKDGTCMISVYQNTKTPHKIRTEGGTLIITAEDERNWLNKFFSVKKQEITVYLPEDIYGKLEINLTTGDVNIAEGFTFDGISVEVTTGNITLASSARGDIKLQTTTGDIEINDVYAFSFDLKLTTGDVSVGSAECDNSFFIKRTTGDVNIRDLYAESFTAHGTTGDLVLESVIVNDTISIEGTTGNVTFDGCDAENISVDVTTGNVKGILLTDKIISTKTTTGKVDVPKLSSGGRLDVSTTTGSIIIKIEK